VRLPAETGFTIAEGLVEQKELLTGVYLVESQNTNANALSRIGSVTAEAKGSTKLDEETKKQILYEFRDAPVGGHWGMNKTFQAIKPRYTWPNMRQETEQYVKQCKSCQVNKTLKPKRKAPMEITSVANHPFDNRYIPTFQDDLSKYVVATPISQHDAETVARVFVLQVVLKYGTPSIVHTDQGANFVNEVFKNTCKLLKIKKIQSTVFHLESQGSIERRHRVLTEYLQHYVKEDQTNWDEWVHFAAYAYNTSEHSATGYTPFELVFGHPSSLPSALRSEPSP
jgi:hypothetical protein